MDQNESILLNTIIKDWREVDGSTDEAQKEHLKNYQVEVKRSGYGGLWIDVVLPNGKTASLLLEGDQGALKVNTYSADPESTDAQDEADIILHIDEQGTQLTPYHTTAGSDVLYSHGEAQQVGGWSPKLALTTNN